MSRISKYDNLMYAFSATELDGKRVQSVAEAEQLVLREVAARGGVLVERPYGLPNPEIWEDAWFNSGVRALFRLTGSEGD